MKANKENIKGDGVPRWLAKVNRPTLDFRLRLWSQGLEIEPGVGRAVGLGFSLPPRLPTHPSLVHTLSLSKYKTKQ